MTWPYPTPESRAARDAHIMELHALGLNRAEIATLVDLTPQRVGQVINSFGVYPKGRYRKEVIAEANSS